MSDAQFWQIIDLLDWEESGNDEAVVAPLVAHLTTLPVSFIYQFQDKLSEKRYNLDTKSHAVPFNTPFSGNDFLYTRCAVVANGKTMYEQILADPFSNADRH